MAEGHNDDQIKDLFTGNTSFFSVPRYQRKYVWEEKNWKQLYEDIEYSLEDENWFHFIGTFVFQKNEISAQNTEYVIIDGQQRIITLQILFMAIIAALNSIKSDDIEENKEIDRYIEIIKDLIIRKPPKGYGNERVQIDYDVCYSKIRETVLVNQDLDDLLCKQSNSNIYKCFKFYYDLLKNKNFEQLESYYEKLIVTKYVGFNSYTEEYAYSIFETLNARGTQLKQMELMKNYLFHYLLPKNDIDIYKSNWAEIENNLFDNNLDCDDFLYHLFKCKYKIHNIRIGDLYDKIKVILNKNSDYIREFYESVISCIPIYISVVNCEDSNEDISFILKYFKIKNNKQFRSVLMSVFYQYKKNIISEKALVKLLQNLRNFMILYNIRKIPANRIDDDVQDLAFNVFNSRCERDVIIYINQFLLKDRSFFDLENITSEIKNLRYSNHKRYTMATSGVYIYLFELIYKSEYVDYEYIKEYKKWTIEHIVNDNIDEDYVSCIGNLLPVTKTLNGKCKSMAYVNKKKKYVGSGYSWIRDYANAQEKEPDKEDIDQRTEMIGRKLAEVIAFNTKEMMEYNNKNEKVKNFINKLQNDKKTDKKILEDIKFDEYEQIEGKLKNKYKANDLLDMFYGKGNAHA